MHAERSPRRCGRSAISVWEDMRLAWRPVLQLKAHPDLLVLNSAVPCLL